MAPHCPANRPATGFSLIELLTTLAISAILLAASIPAMGSFAAHQALISASNSLVTGLQLARNQAISSGKPVRLCPAYDESGCADRTAWSHGWRVQSESTSLTGGLHHGQLPAHIQVSLSQGRQHVRFLPDGRSPGTNLTLHLCSRQRASRQIIINNSGRVRSGPVSTAPC